MYPGGYIFFYSCSVFFRLAACSISALCQTKNLKAIIPKESPPSAYK
ncbi:unknown protein [Simkania negevensis Z]|uniref:Uncharacterized protein n=1 Tax=Simkania negevensis (strain ATCC VR-1471 / DSM 27360 / Z) TaxID=331113 RepID=F8L872_SIMNZ|nr:unknown protein [Simkania negevensis Z]